MNRILLNIILLVTLLWLSLPVVGGKSPDIALQSLSALPIDSLFKKGEAAIDSGNRDEAIQIFTLICSADDGNGDRRLFAKAHQRRGYMLYSGENFAEAMQDYLQARGIAERNGLRDMLPGIYTDIGNVFSSTNDLESGIMFYRKALATDAARENRDLLPILYNNMLYAYYLKAEGDSVKKYFTLFSDVNPTDLRSRYDLLMNRGLLDDIEGNQEKAVEMYHRAAGFARDSLNSPDCEAAANSNIARSYERSGLADSAMYYLQINERMAREKGYNNLLVESLRDMARIHDRMGHKTEALQCKSEYLSLSDSLFSRETMNLIKNSQALYEQNSDAYTIRALNDTNAQQRGWIMTLFAVLAVIALLSVLLWRQKRKLTNAYRDLYERNVTLLEAERKYAERIGTLENRITALTEKSGADTADLQSTRKPLIPKEQRELLLAKIGKVLESPAFYCDADCSIDRLASAIDSNARYVSEVINTEYGMNFRSFINKYRVKEAMRRLEDVEHYGHLTIKAVAESVGYKSQATFISVFSKETGLKPSLYQQLALRRRNNTTNEPE